MSGLYAVRNPASSVTTTAAGAASSAAAMQQRKPDEEKSGLMGLYAGSTGATMGAEIGAHFDPKKVDETTVALKGVQAKGAADLAADTAKNTAGAVAAGDAAKTAAGTAAKQPMTWAGKGAAIGASAMMLAYYLM